MNAPWLMLPIRKAVLVPLVVASTPFVPTRSTPTAVHLATSLHVSMASNHVHVCFATLPLPLPTPSWWWTVVTTPPVSALPCWFTSMFTSMFTSVFTTHGRGGGAWCCRSRGGEGDRSVPLAPPAIPTLRVWGLGREGTSAFLSSSHHDQPHAPRGQRREERGTTRRTDEG